MIDADQKNASRIPRWPQLSAALWVTLSNLICIKVGWCRVLLQWDAVYPRASPVRFGGPSIRREKYEPRKSDFTRSGLRHGG